MDRTEAAAPPLPDLVQNGFFLARTVFRPEVGACARQLGDPIFEHRAAGEFPGGYFGHVGGEVCPDVGACGRNTAEEPTVGGVNGPGADEF
jgi:hypothetical protein